MTSFRSVICLRFGWWPCSKYVGLINVQKIIIYLAFSNHKQFFSGGGRIIEVLTITSVVDTLQNVAMGGGGGGGGGGN